MQITGSTSSSSSTMPEAIDHVGIIVHNRLIEYGHNGVVKSPVGTYLVKVVDYFILNVVFVLNPQLPRNGEDPIPQYPGCKLRKREFLGKTCKTRREFVEWMVNVKYERFR